MTKKKTTPTKATKKATKAQEDLFKAQPKAAVFTEGSFEVRLEEPYKSGNVPMRYRYSCHWTIQCQGLHDVELREGVSLGTTKQKAVQAACADSASAIGEWAKDLQKLMTKVLWCGGEDLIGGYPIFVNRPLGQPLRGRLLPQCL